RAAFGVRASASGFEASAEVGRALTEWEARDASVRAEGAFVAALSPVVANLRPGGVMSASIPALRWTDSTMNGSGPFEWRNAAAARRRASARSPHDPFPGRILVRALSLPFKPAWWLPNPHLQTIYGSQLARAPRVAMRRERWDAPDGDFVDVDFIDAPTAASPW